MKRIAPAALVLALPLALAGCPNAKPKPPKNTPRTPDEPRAPDKPKTPDKPKAPPKAAMKQSDMKSPWRKAKVGDWAEYDPHFGLGAFRHEITDISDGQITYVMTKKGTDSKRPVPVSFEDLEKSFNPPETLNPPPKVKEVELKLKNGKTLKCKYYKREGLGSTTETWLCDDIPLQGGIVKSIQNGKVNLEITDFKKAE